MVARTKPRARFDLAYYDRFYRSRKTRIYSKQRQWQLTAGVVGLCEWFGVELNSVLDIGAGVGWWRDWFAEHRPTAVVTSTELEADICARFHHQQADITTWRSEQTYDLIICQGVLPYVTNRGLPGAIENIAAMSGGMLYLEAITRGDVKQAVDASLTDLAIHRRTAATYRQLLRPHFREVGGGLWMRRGGGATLFELELPPEPSAAAQ